MSTRTFEIGSNLAAATDKLDDAAYVASIGYAIYTVIIAFAVLLFMIMFIYLAFTTPMNVNGLNMQNTQNSIPTTPTR